MFLPHPESDLRQSVMLQGVEIVNFLKKEGRVFTEIALENFLKQDVKRTPEEFVNTIVFLYAVGMVDQESYWLKLSCYQK